MSLVRRVARPLLAAIFVVGGLDALRHPAAGSQGRAARSSKARPPLRPAQRPRAPRPGQRRRHGRRRHPARDGPDAAARVDRARRVARPDHAIWAPVLGGDRPAAKRGQQRTTSSRTSACSAVCCSRPSTPRASPGSGVPSTAHGRPVAEPHRQDDQARGAARRRPELRAARPGSRCPGCARRDRAELAPPAAPTMRLDRDWPAPVGRRAASTPTSRCPAASR